MQSQASIWTLHSHSHTRHCFRMRNWVLSISIWIFFFSSILQFYLFPSEATTTCKNAKMDFIFLSMAEAEVCARVEWVCAKWNRFFFSTFELNYVTMTQFMCFDSGVWFESIEFHVDRYLRAQPPPPSPWLRREREKERNTNSSRAHIDR